MTTDTIEWAAREKRRSVNDAVGRNFFKTVTEPVTNSDSALKKRAAVPHASGLIDLMLAVDEGRVLDTAHLKFQIPRVQRRRIEVDLTTKAPNARLCRVVDYGPGMTETELREKFRTYASAKARGEKTRSLFGRGALDVLLYHEASEIFSVANGNLSHCKVFWDEDPKRSVTVLGQATDALLRRHGLPVGLKNGGTEVRFKLKEGTHIPGEDRLLAQLSAFSMLRLIAADPNTEIIVTRNRTAGTLTDTLAYDFPIGDVLAQRKDNLDLGNGTKLPISILVARSQQELVADNTSIERRENGLLFLDDNDAVMDLTLLPDWDKNPYLNQIFGVVRVSGIRAVLEQYLEDEDAIAVLRVTRDGFDTKHELTKKLFELVEKHVKPVYEREIQRRKKSDGKRSEKLAKKIRGVLKALNQFNTEETEDTGGGTKKKPANNEAIFFSHEGVTLYTGMPRHITLSVDTGKVKKGEIVLFETDNPLLTVTPESHQIRVREGQTHDSMSVTVLSGAKDTTGTIIATTVSRSGGDLRAVMRVVAVIDPPVPQPPTDIDFSAHVYSGQPNRENHAFLLMNMKMFTGLPEISLALEKGVGSVSFDDHQSEKIKVKVSKEQITDDVARIPISFFGTGWGQHAEMVARVKRTDGETCHAKAKLKFERHGSDKFSNIEYEDLQRPVLGDVADDKLYINAGYPVHQQLFGASQDEFDLALDSNPVAQVRAATVLVEAAVYSIATKKYVDGGAKGLYINADDPIGSVRKYLEESRMKLEPQIIRALMATTPAPATPPAKTTIDAGSSDP